MSILQWLKFMGVLLNAKQQIPLAKTEDFAGRYRRLRAICLGFYKNFKIDIEVTGVENIPVGEAVYFISNHQGTFDPLLLVAANPQPMTFISKVENLKLPVIGTWGKLIGFITFDREAFDENVTMLRSAIRTLKDGKSILVFPEGTRSKQQTLLPFKTGAILPAYLAKANVVCVTQNYNHECDRLGQLKHRLEVHFHPMLRFDQYQNLSHQQTMDFCVQTIQSKLK